MPPGRPPSVPDRTLPETITALQSALEKRPADVPVWLGRVALRWLERLQAREAELFHLRDVAERYTDLSEHWNALYAAAQVQIYQQFGSEVWNWRLGERSGVAESPGAALVAALLAE